MNDVFADTAYWIALINSSDKWNSKAKELDKIFQKSKVITCDEVLIEFLTFYSSFGNSIRINAANFVFSILQSSRVLVIPQNRASFINGLTMYKKMFDKKYSIVDCISMQIIKEYNLTKVLTSDKHFEQAGFEILLK